MKTYITIVTLFVVFAAACTNNPATTANNGGANANAPTNSNAAAVVNTQNSPAVNAEQNTKSTSTKIDKTENSGQNSERVQFAAGKTGTNLKRDIPANGSIDFVFSARSGQRLQYSVMYDKGSDTDVEVFLTEPGLQDISNTSAANENNEFMIEKTGDHRITVNNTTGKKVNVDFGIVLK